MKIILKGGPTSGHYNHAGRAGQVGGSLPGSKLTGSSNRKYSLTFFPTRDAAPEEYATLCAMMKIKNMTKEQFADAIQTMYQVEDKKSGLKSVITNVKFSMYPLSSTIKSVVSIDGEIRTADGSYAGKFTRDITYTNSETVVKHEWLDIEYEYKDKGFGSTFYQHNEDTYMNMGFERIELDAGLSQGGYVWAKLGFDFNSMTDKDTEMTVASFYYKYRQRYGFDTKEPNFEHAWEMAAYVGPDGYKIGKDGMMGTYWHGYKNLTPNSIQVQIGDAYYNSKRLDKRKK